MASTKPRRASAPTGQPPSGTRCSPTSRISRAVPLPSSRRHRGRDGDDGVVDAAREGVEKPAGEGRRGRRPGGRPRRAQRAVTTGLRHLCQGAGRPATAAEHGVLDDAAVPQGEDVGLVAGVGDAVLLPARVSSSSSPSGRGTRCSASKRPGSAHQPARASSIAVAPRMACASSARWRRRRRRGGRRRARCGARVRWRR